VVSAHDLPAVAARHKTIIFLSMILSDLASPAEAGFAKAGNRFPLFGIMPLQPGKNFRQRQKRPGAAGHHSL
jgi:hypothetical protein